jgi:hypothetical protein
MMAVNANAKMGFYTALGVLSALLVWNFLSSRVPALKQFG